MLLFAGKSAVKLHKIVFTQSHGLWHIFSESEAKQKINYNFVECNFAIVAKIQRDTKPLQAMITMALSTSANLHFLKSNVHKIKLKKNMWWDFDEPSSIN